VSRSSTEGESGVMAHTTCEMVWLKSLIWELRFSVAGLIPMCFDNQVVIYIASNSFFRERTKHTEMNCHFCSRCGLSKVNFYLFALSYEELAYKT